VTTLRPLRKDRDYFLGLLELLIKRQWPTRVHLAGVEPPKNPDVAGRLHSLHMPRLNVILEGEAHSIHVGPPPDSMAGEVCIAAGEAEFYPPHAPYQALWKSPCFGLGLVWCETFIRLVAYEHLGGPRLIPVSPFSYHTVHPLGERANHLLAAMESRIPGHWETAELAALARLMVAETRRHVEADPMTKTRKSKAERTWFDAERFIILHLNHPLDRDHVAASIGVTPSHLSTLCRRKTGKTFQQYVMGIRLEHARQLLRNTRMKASDVAAACGFLNPRHFNDAFTAAHGVSPLRWRKSIAGTE
jgi:AraC-like DNA-binding protein